MQLDKKFKCLEYLLCWWDKQRRWAVIIQLDYWRLGEFAYRQTSVNNYRYTLRNIPEGRSPQLRCDGILDSRKYRCCLCCHKSSKNLETWNFYQHCTWKYESIQFTKYIIDTDLIEVNLSIYLALRTDYIENSGYSCFSWWSLSTLKFMNKYRSDSVCHHKL
jgi:hypothetical protein